MNDNKKIMQFFFIKNNSRKFVTEVIDKTEWIYTLHSKILFHVRPFMVMQFSFFGQSIVVGLPERFVDGDRGRIT